MKSIVIENPIVNSPFEEPKRHFRFDDEGITSEIVEKRRTNQYFIHIAKPKKKTSNYSLKWSCGRAIALKKTTLLMKYDTVFLYAEIPWDAENTIRDSLNKSLVSA